MTNQNICRYNKFGFCKYGEVCRKKYISEKCYESSCEVGACDLRHPKICKYYREFRRCKFGQYCYFDHKETDSEALEKKVNELTIKVENLEKKMKEEHIVQLKSDSEKIKKLVQEKDDLIQELVKKIELMDQKINERSESNQEKSLVEKSVLACKFCPFEAKSVAGLKVHTKRKHTFKEIDSYPTKCEICESSIENKLMMKRHMKDHSFKRIEYKCLDCNFFSSKETEMEVHIGMEHTDGFEFCLCGCIEDSSEKLETHLLTCEVFDCGECHERTKTLDSVKKHLEEKHQKYLNINEIYHLKFSTENFTDIKKKGYYYKDV